MIRRPQLFGAGQFRFHLVVYVLLFSVAIYGSFTLVGCTDSKNTAQNQAAKRNSTEPQRTLAPQIVEPDKPSPAKTSAPQETTSAQQIGSANNTTKTAPPPLAKASDTAVSSAVKTNRDPEITENKAGDATTLAKSKDVKAAPDMPPRENTASMPTKPAVASVKEPVTNTLLSLSVNIIIGQRKQADGSYCEIPVSEGSVLLSRDNFQFHLKTDRSGYVYVLIHDSQGKATQIYPDPKAGQSAAMQGNQQVIAPAKDLWFWLDDSTGTESIYVLASEQPLTDISGLLTKMEGSSDAQKLASRQLKEL